MYNAFSLIKYESMGDFIEDILRRAGLEVKASFFFANKKYYYFLLFPLRNCNFP